MGRGENVDKPGRLDKGPRILGFKDSREKLRALIKSFPPEANPILSENPF